MFLLVVVGLALLLLTLAFRSILVPLKAVAGFLLSLAATFGALVAVFQWGWLAGLLGVAVDRPDPELPADPARRPAVRPRDGLRGLPRQPDARGPRPRRRRRGEAIIGGFRHGARVVTAAALIMASVFAGFILGDDPTIKSIGFALAFGVAVDAFVVRMTLVPAVMALLGRPGLVAAALARPGAARRRHRGRPPRAPRATDRRPASRHDPTNWPAHRCQPSSAEAPHRPRRDRPERRRPRRRHGPVHGGSERLSRR